MRPAVVVVVLPFGGFLADLIERPEDVIVQELAPDNDTLDWRSYYPLQVGNVWEYSHSVGDPVESSLESVVGDTVANSRRYFRLRTEQFSEQFGGLFSSWELYLRYDSTGRILGFRDVDDDTSSAEHPERVIHVGYDLRTAFGDTVRGVDDKVLYWTEGGYFSMVKIAGQYYEVPAFKRFTDGASLQSFASGIRVLRGGNLWSRHLTYARVENDEFGRRQTDTNDESVSDNRIALLDVDVYPIPASNDVTIDLYVSRHDRVTLELYNSAGQCVWPHRTKMFSPGRHRWDFKGSNLASGAYLLRAATPRGDTAEAHLLIAR